MIIAVDVDLTVCPVDIYWWKWLNAQYKTDFEYPDPSHYDQKLLNYDLGDYFYGLPEPYENFNSIYYFRSDSLYDYIKYPISESVNGLKNLSSLGHRIVFVSHIKGNHHKSKYRWLKKNFPFMDGFLATQEKEYVKADYLIDDRNSHLNNFKIGNPRSRVIKFKTNFEQCQELDNPCFTTNDWSNISDRIIHEM